MALDKENNYTQFGSRLYIFWTEFLTQKGFWNQENEFWKNDIQPANTGRVRYALGNKTEHTPSTTICPILLSPRKKHPTALSSPLIGDPLIQPCKEESRDWIGGGLHLD